MVVEIVEELGWAGPRTENPFRILVDGEIYTTPEGFSLFWTEAEALRHSFKNLGVVPLGKVRQIPKRESNG